MFFHWLSPILQVEVYWFFFCSVPLALSLSVSLSSALSFILYWIFRGYVNKTMKYHHCATQTLCVVFSFFLSLTLSLYTLHNWRARLYACIEMCLHFEQEIVNAARKRKRINKLHAVSSWFLTIVLLFDSVLQIHNWNEMKWKTKNYDYWSSQ